MKRNLVAVIFSITLIAGSAVRGQAPDANDEEKLLAFVQELKARQLQIADNQAKIDAKVTDLEETIRISRIFVSKTGGPHKPVPPKK